MIEEKTKKSFVNYGTGSRVVFRFGLAFVPVLIVLAITSLVVVGGLLVRNNLRNNNVVTIDNSNENSDLSSLQMKGGGSDASAETEGLTAEGNSNTNDNLENSTQSSTSNPSAYGHSPSSEGEKISLPLSPSDIENGNSLSFLGNTISNEELDNNKIKLSGDDSNVSDNLHLGETLKIQGGEGIDAALSNNTITVSGEDASTTNKGVSQYAPTQFNVTDGDVEIQDIYVRNDGDTINGPLNLNGDFTMVGDTSLTGDLDVFGNIFLAGGGTLDTRSAGTLLLGGTTQTGLTLGRNGAVTTLKGMSLVVDPTSWTATPTISGLLTTTSGIISNGAVTINNTATINDDTTINGDTNITGATNIIGDTGITGITNIIGATTITGLANINTSGTKSTNIGNSVSVLTLNGSNTKIDSLTTTIASTLISLTGSSPVLNNTTGTLYINNVNNNPVTFGSGVITTGNIMPLLDDTYDIGSSTTRYRDLYLGPTSLHVYSNASETTVARDWKLSIQETNGASEGNLRIMEGTNEWMTVDT